MTDEVALGKHYSAVGAYDSLARPLSELSEKHPGKHATEIAGYP